MPGVPFLTAQLGALARLIVEAAWGADLTTPSGTWTWSDITADVRQADGQKVSIRQGRGDEASQAQPASCAFQLDNTSGDYSPYNPSGNNYPHVRRNTPIRVSLDPGNGTGTYVRFFGFANGFTPSWDKSAKLAVVSVSASGTLRRLMQGKGTLQSPIRHAFAADPKIVAYWPGEDKGGSIGSGLPGGSPLALAGTVEFANESTLTGSDSALTLTTTSDLSGAVDYAFSGNWQVDWFTKIPSAPAAETVLVRVAVSGGTVVTWQFVVGTTGGTPYQAVHGYDVSGTRIVDSGNFTLPAFALGSWVHFALTAQQSGGTVNWWLLEYPIYIGGTGISGSFSGTVGDVANVRMPASAGLDGVSVAHLAVWDGYMYPAWIRPGQGFGPDPVAGTHGELAIYRMARLCIENKIELEPIIDGNTEDFEDTSFNYTITGTWARNNTQSYSGSWSLKSATIGNSAQADAVVTVPPGARLMTVWFKVSSEEDFDFFEVYRDGTLLLQQSGDVDWRQYVLAVTGASTVTFRYVKDSAVAAGLDAAWIDGLAFTTQVGMGPQTVDTFVNLVRECETTDGGVLFDGFGQGLGYISNEARYNQPVAMTVDASAGQLAEPPAPADDDQRNRNLVKVTRKSGSSAVYADETGPLGTSTIGTYDTSITVNVDVDTGLRDRASWEVHKGTVEGLRYPSLGLDFAAVPALAAAWLATALNERIDVTNIASKAVQHPPGTVSLLLEGYTETLAPYEWRATLNCSPAAPWQVFVLDTDRLDADPSSQLVAGITATATTFQVQTAAISGALWTTNSAEWTAPKTLYINIAGEQMQVTNITGASSPQTFTVIRSVNGVVKTQIAGAYVGLWQPRVLAL